MNGTKPDDQGQSPVVDTSDDDFNAIAKALHEGNSAELDKLFDAEPAPKDETEVETPDEPADPESPDETGEEVTPDEEQEEAAEPAAPTAPPQSGPTPDERDLELHRLRSEAGRVPFIQRRIAELERELRAHKARQPDTTATGGKPAAPTNLKDIELDPDTQKDIDELKEIDPVMARTLERVAKTAIATANARAEQAINSFTEHDQEVDDQRFFLEQKAELARMIPQHEAIFATPEWRQWKETLTPGRRNLAESGYATEVAQAIYAFAADMQARQAPQTPTATPQPTGATETPESREALEARNRKAATGVEVKNTAAKKVVEFNEDDYFKEMYNKIGKDNHIL